VSALPAEDVPRQFAVSRHSDQPAPAAQAPSREAAGGANRGERYTLRADRGGGADRPAAPSQEAAGRPVEPGVPYRGHRGGAGARRETLRLGAVEGPVAEVARLPTPARKSGDFRYEWRGDHGQINNATTDSRRRGRAGSGEPGCVSTGREAPGA